MLLDCINVTITSELWTILSVIIWKPSFIDYKRKTTINYSNKYRSVLLLILSMIKTINFKMNPKLQKSKKLNEIIKNKNFQYKIVTENLQFLLDHFIKKVKFQNANS